MDSDREEDRNTMVTELEVAEENEEKEPMEVEAPPLDGFLMERSCELPSLRNINSRSGNKFSCVDQMMLL